MSPTSGFKLFAVLSEGEEEEEATPSTSPACNYRQNVFPEDLAEVSQVGTTSTLGALHESSFFLFIFPLEHMSTVEWIMTLEEVSLIWQSRRCAYSFGII